MTRPTTIETVIIRVGTIEPELYKSQSGDSICLLVQGAGFYLSGTDQTLRDFATKIIEALDRPEMEGN